MADGRHFWKKPLNRHLSDRLTDLEEMWQVDANCPPTGVQPLHFRNFRKPRWRVQPPSSKSQQSRHHLNGLTDFNEIWHGVANLPPYR